MSKESHSVTPLAGLIRELAQRTGKSTQEAQATNLGISDTALSNYLSGAQVPREKTFLNMLTNVGVPKEEHPKYLATLAGHRRTRNTGMPDETGQSSPSSQPPSGSAPTSWNRPWTWTYAAVAAAAASALISLNVPRSSSAPSPQAQAVLNVTTTLRCGLVKSPSSPVYAEVGNATPVKFKSSGDRVRLVAADPRTGSDGTVYQAVALPDPHDSPTGIGWMPGKDLEPDPRQCVELGERP
ncbi:helix-turn-helix domain-containing protein [Nonomuraea sp. NPDC050783]|uniref:helix-turn-helix domain-containing protein n=1 Tax=Nonomuraea sp. NPDC050783 TaxID=3154634 RepID=UPI0034656963